MSISPTDRIAVGRRGKTERRLGLLAVVAAALAAASGPSLAQTDPTPQAETAAPERPATTVQQGGGRRLNEVVASELDEVDPFVVGALTPAEGGLPSTLWRGSDPAAIAAAASRTPSESGFLAASDMAARALLSAGAAPQGAGDRRAAAQERLEALLRLGRVDAADTIVTQVPRGLEEPAFAAFAVRARLAKNDIGGACRVGDALPTGRDGSFWLRLRTACYAWAGETAAAQLTLDLAREAEASVADEAFTTWVFAAAAQAVPDKAPAPRDALESALAQSAGFAFDLETLERLPLLVAVGLSRDETAAPDVRAFAARRAARAGAASAADLSAAYAGVAAPSDLSAAALIARAREAEFPLAEAMLLRAASAPGATAFEVAEAIEVALARAQTPADFILAAGGLAPVLQALAPSEDLVLVAPEFAVAAAAIGARATAYAWLDPGAPGLAAPSDADASFAPIFNARPDFSRSPIEPSARIAAEAVVAAADPSASPERLAAVAAARLAAAAEGDEAAQASARRDVLILVALGAEASSELRRAASDAVAETYVADDAVNQSLSLARLAADAGALGETALYLAQAASDAGPAHAPTVASAIEIARRAGLATDARALAVEAMLTARLAAADAAQVEGEVN